MFRVPSPTRARAALRIWLARVWLLLQTAVAGTTAWVVADQIGDHPEPFFAPITAVIVLNSVRGERAQYALRLLLGVLVGIASAEVTLLVLGGGYLPLGVAMFAALAIVALFSRTQLTLNQAGASAILTMVLAGDEAGLDRMIDALIGAGVAIVFTQVFFSPEPIALVRRAESTALTRLAEGLTTTAEAVRREGGGASQPEISQFRDIRDALGEVARARVNSQGVVQRGTIWRFRRAALPPVIENARQLELLGASCLLLLRTAVLINPARRRQLAQQIHRLADILERLAADPGSKKVRQDAVNRTLRIASDARRMGSTPARVPQTAQVSVLMVAYDILVFAGVTPQQARAAVRGSSRELPVAGLPGTFSLPLWRLRRG